MWGNLGTSLKEIDKDKYNSTNASYNVEQFWETT